MGIAQQRRKLITACKKWYKWWRKALFIPAYWTINLHVLDEVEQDTDWAMYTEYDNSYNWADIKVQPNVKLEDVPWMMLHEMLHVLHARMTINEAERHVMESTIQHLTSVIWALEQERQKLADWEKARQV